MVEKTTQQNTAPHPKANYTTEKKTCAPFCIKARREKKEMGGGKGRRKEQVLLIYASAGERKRIQTFILQSEGTQK